MTTRIKTCLYRHCGVDFVDQHLGNNGKYCAPECARREKAFRLGHAVDETYFRLKGVRAQPKCTTCHKPFPPADKGTRCPDCRSSARNKVCRKCASPYLDNSEKNTRRFCGDCQSRG